MTEWIQWDGGECPIPDAKAGEYEVKTRGGKIFSENDASFWEWKHMKTAIGSGSMSDIIAYRLIEKEQSDLDWLEGEILARQEELLDTRETHECQTDFHREWLRGKAVELENVLGMIKSRKEAKS